MGIFLFKQLSPLCQFFLAGSDMQLVQVLPSVLRKFDNGLGVDVDFVEALRSYLRHFESVCVACPVTENAGDAGLDRCELTTDLPWKAEQLKFLPLPKAYGLTSFVTSFSRVRQILRAEIKAADYLIFSPHSLIGDWPTVAIWEAIKLRRRYVIEADVVYESLRDADAHRKPAMKRFVDATLLSPLFVHSYHYSLNHSSLALFQGRDVYDAYAPYCSNAHKVYHHIPIYSGDHISGERLQEKIGRVMSGEPLNICYVGRAIDMKGPLDWLETVSHLIRSGVSVRATWLGDGSLLSEMRARAARLAISGHVHFPGFVADRGALLSFMQSSDIFLFTHKTRESARCLGEALASGCPLVGYYGSYPADLVANSGGGLFVEQGNVPQLVEVVRELDKKREVLSSLIEGAARAGQMYDRAKRMDERMMLIKNEMGPSNKSL
jgi:glycosyltransferase involved in cell wall biosynthesis